MSLSMVLEIGGREQVIVFLKNSIFDCCHAKVYTKISLICCSLFPLIFCFNLKRTNSYGKLSLNQVFRNCLLSRQNFIKLDEPIKNRYMRFYSPFSRGLRRIP